MKNGCIIAIIVPGIPKLCGLFGRDTEYVIPFRCIKQVGEEIILVQVKEDDIIKNVNFDMLSDILGEKELSAK